MNDHDMNSVELDDERAQLKGVHVPRDEKQGRKLGGEIDNDFVSWLDVRMKSAEWETYERGSEDFLGIETDLEKLSKSDMEAARKLWKENTPPGMNQPFYLTPEFEAARGRDTAEQGQGRTSLEKPPTGPQKHAGEAEQESGYRVPSGVQSRYLVANNRFFFRDQKNQLAFEDHGRKMVTEHNNPDVAKSLVELAEAKGWSKIKVSGHEDFKREVWLQATLKGIEVTGYKAKDADIAKLQEMRSARAKNAIEHDDGRAPKKGKDVDEDRAYEEPRQNKADNFKGKLLDHGRANFDFNEKNDPNYFVKLETANGTKMHWGLDLERAVEHAGTKVGELIELERLGKKPVTVQEKQYDKDGQLIGYKPVETERVEWKATALEKAKEATVAIAKVGEVLVNAPASQSIKLDKAATPQAKAKPVEQSKATEKAVAKAKTPALTGEYKVAASVLQRVLKKEGLSPEAIKRATASAKEMLHDMATKGQPAPGVKVFDRTAQRERPREKIVSKTKDQQQERSR